MQIKRRKSRKIFVGNVAIGAESPVSIQSMTTTNTADVAATVRQIRKLEKAGCQIIRVAVLNEAAARAISAIKRRISIPLVADIHFDYRLALLSIENGADKIRINPGNMRNPEHVKRVVFAAKQRSIPIRIGINSGSVIRTLKNKIIDDMVAAAANSLNLFKGFGYEQIIISLKANDVLTTIEAYRRVARITDAPLHLGVTAAGLLQSGIVKSSIGIGVLLLEGIGDTIRVSLTSDPVYEVSVAQKILSAVGIRNSGIDIISCPTCGRCTINLIQLVKQAEKALLPFQEEYAARKLKVAIMGCAVNGPGEAKDADIGIAWAGAAGILFKKGRKVKNVKENELIKTLIAEVRNEMV
ncbi:MAG: flavodoxin-dependent (E)-4-hydroxy-3-methylbut-2-enyl-diphosphate synthase [Candidatus Omnitrophica bacterium]|nr:flavodoxin-dependent (E)-4-hydroxy-3-methylbut-2-enyl-diphosphate synthase [Candidatus Omnitrophota bacterium]MBU4479658.1 flavodoxin-dependent (E)-4-hydroxy-3-methylbut-2-enyl-diphosphate synthase [Candidatus Omnitrophota bacterium]MCG2703662.1 flavodoxin-dependent (E)-4-hydroxy-3-methylbut-2-enyl-diphosphate synthase [Candidatus Omnitrophota bacterium]